ncbi:MAG: tRNA pseudouridine synthase A, partial [Burkholderiales bacterium]
MSGGSDDELRDSAAAPAAEAQAPSRRIALGLSYDGSGFSGWQVQPDARTVQATLEAAVAAIAAHPVRVACAGRTDAGVHALAQVAHFDTTARRPASAWVRGVNAGLPPDVAVHWAREVPAGFDARYSAIERCYRYVLLESPVRAPLWRNHAGW